MTEDQKAHIRTLAEYLDVHRKRQQSQHPKLTLTDIYNVLEKVRAVDLSGFGEPLDAKERVIHEQGLVSILQQIHDALDVAVFEAYGWPSDLTDEDILQRLVDLNAARAAEEASGLIRWLRPDYQAPQTVPPKQGTFLEQEEAQGPHPLEVGGPSTEKQDWPKALKDRATAVRAALASFARPVDVADIAGNFNGPRTQKRLEEVGDILDMLTALGQAGVQEGKYSLG